MLETLIVLTVLNFTVGVYNFVKHRELEVIVFYGNYPGNFPDDPRNDDDADLPKSMKLKIPRPGGKVKIKPISLTDEDLFELEKTTK
jgi:hypothetical protein